MPLDNTLKTLKAFFPQDGYTEENVENGLEGGDIIDNPSQITNYLQSSMHDESLLEMELGDLTRIFFCRVLDHPPEMVEKTEDGEIVFQEIKYSKGEYFNDMDHIIITPLEPAIGNFIICNTPRLVLRLLTSMAAIEFCTTFIEKTKVHGMPVLRCSYPSVARQVKGVREYRAKVPEEMLFEVRVTGKNNSIDFLTSPMDICVSGMCLFDPAGKKSTLRPDDAIHVDVLANGEEILSLNALIRHVTRLRDAKGLQYVFGVQFDLASRALAADVEKLVAGVQRVRLRELSQIGDEYGIDFGKF